eukprot:761037_1
MSFVIHILFAFIHRWRKCLMTQDHSQILQCTLNENMGNKASGNASVLPSSIDKKCSDVDKESENTKEWYQKSVDISIKSNHSLQLLISGYIKQIFHELTADKSYESIIKHSIPSSIYQLCLSMYGLVHNRYMFQLENLSHNTCTLQYKNQMHNPSKKSCIIEHKELLTNCSYKHCKSLYINNIKTNDSYSDAIVLCAAQNHFESQIKYYASMIAISDYAANIQSLIVAKCSVIAWYPYWNAGDCSNLTYDKQHGLMVSVHCARRKQHTVYHLKLMDEYPEWKALIVIDKHLFEQDPDHVHIQIVSRKNRKYLFMSDGRNVTKLYDFEGNQWIDVESNENIIDVLAKICYDEINNRLYFIDISYCCYFDVDEYKWVRITAPGFWSTTKDIIYIHDCCDRKDLMIVGRNYYFTYNAKIDQWNHRYTLERDVEHKDHESFMLV